MKQLVGGHIKSHCHLRKMSKSTKQSFLRRGEICLLGDKTGKKPSIQTRFYKFMNELIFKCSARESTSAEEAQKCWYLPHHGVYHSNKPGKIHVFDLSAECHGTSINEAFLSTPNLTNQIFGV